MQYLDFIKQIKTIHSGSANVVFISCEDWLVYDGQLLCKLNKELPSCTFHQSIPNNHILVEFDSIIGVLEQIPEVSFVVPLLKYNASWLNLILSNAKIDFAIRHVQQGEEILRNYEDSDTTVMSEDTDLVYVTNIVLSDSGKDVITEIRNRIIDGKIRV